MIPQGQLIISNFILEKNQETRNEGEYIVPDGPATHCISLDYITEDNKCITITIEGITSGGEQKIRAATKSEKLYASRVRIANKQRQKDEREDDLI